MICACISVHGWYFVTLFLELKTVKVTQKRFKTTSLHFLARLIAMEACSGKMGHLAVGPA